MNHPGHRTSARGHRPRLLRRLALIPATVAATLVFGAAPLLAADQTITSAGPLDEIIISDELNCQVAHTADTVYEFFSPGDRIGACGTLVAVGGTLYGPSALPAGGSAAPRTTYTLVSQSAVTGAGTVADPFSIVTVVDAGTSGLRLTETDSYVVGQESYRTNVQLTNSGSAALNVIVYRAGDCFLQGSDNGFGAVDTATGAVSCVAPDPANPSVPGSRIEQWFPLTPGSNFFQAQFNTVWAHIGGQTAFPNTCECTINQDNGAGLSWSLSIAAGTSATVSHFTTFSPLGQAPLVTSKAADAATSAPGGTNGYTVQLNNPNAGSITVTSITDTLPAGFAYVAGSTTGLTTSNPAVAGQTLTWSGPFTVSANGFIFLRFNVTVSTTPGTYTNQAGGTAEGTSVTGTGAAAPITVPGAAVAPPATPLLPNTGVAGSAQDGGSSAIGFLGVVLVGSLGLLLVGNLRRAGRRER